MKNILKPNWDATPKQINFLELLLNDIGVVTQKQKRYWIETTIDRLPDSVSEITKGEAGKCIARAQEKRYMLRGEDPDINDWNEYDEGPR